MRDEATIDAIFLALRDLLLRRQGMSVCALIHAAVDPAVPNEEIRRLSDAALLRQLRAMAFFGSNRADPDVVTAEHLAAMDQARDYDAASAYNWLNAELGRLQQRVRVGGAVRIEEDFAPIVLVTEAEFAAWARGRYPFAEPAKPSDVG